VTWTRLAAAAAWLPSMHVRLDGPPARLAATQRAAACTRGRTKRGCETPAQKRTPVVNVLRVCMLVPSLSWQTTGFHKKKAQSNACCSAPRPGLRAQCWCCRAHCCMVRSLHSTCSRRSPPSPDPLRSYTCSDQSRSNAQMGAQNGATTELESDRSLDQHLTEQVHGVTEHQR
jgi:hypothetical protein